jgi:hypothetical protein
MQTSVLTLALTLLQMTGCLSAAAAAKKPAIATTITRLDCAEYDTNYKGYLPNLITVSKTGLVVYTRALIIMSRVGANRQFSYQLEGPEIAITVISANRENKQDACCFIIKCV